MDDSILDMSNDEIIVQGTPQDSNSLAAFSRNIVSCFGIKNQKEFQRPSTPHYHNQTSI